MLLVAGCEESSSDVDAACKRILTVLLAELPLKQAVSITQRLTNKNHRAIYQLALQLKQHVVE